jgi:putative RecB family exonuclease
MEKKIMLTVNSLWDDAWKIEIDEATKNGEIKLEDLRQSSRTTKANPNGENAAWWYENGKKFLSNWITWRDNSGWKIWTTPDNQPAIEIAFNVVIGGIYFKGAIDRVFVTPEGELVILDLKTGQ